MRTNSELAVMKKVVYGMNEGKGPFLSFVAVTLNKGYSRILLEGEVADQVFRESGAESTRDLEDRACEVEILTGDTPPIAFKFVRFFNCKHP